MTAEIFWRGALLALGAMILLAPPGISAQEREGRYGPSEMALLPPYCKHTQIYSGNVPGGNDPTEIRKWRSIMGTTFSHMHHYCWGLYAANRAARARTKQERVHNLGVAVNEFDYVIARAPADFVLLPEILTKKGETLIRLDKGPLAIRELQRAIELKPEYWPPYLHGSDYYRLLGDRAEARRWLESGLSAAPDVKVMQSRLARLEKEQSKR